MLNGAFEIIGGVQGLHLHPFHLAASQSADALGYIMVEYRQEEGAPGRGTWYDLFHFRGPVIVECARFSQDLRFVVQHEAALRAFETLRSRPSTKVSLYHADPRSLESLRSTCYYTPCLQLQRKALTEKQLQAQLRLTTCRNGIIECSSFGPEKPVIYLAEIRSEADLMSFRPPLKTGRLLLYDIDQNGERLRHTVCPEPDEPPRADSNAAAGETPGDEHSANPSESPPTKNSESSELVRASERLVRSFRQKLVDSVGRRSETLLARAEEEIRFLTPGFDASRLTDETAVFVPELFEKLVRGAPYFRRHGLREAAALLLADHYAKQYDLLERHGAANAVEHVYYRLKQ